MQQITLPFLTEQVELAETLQAGRDTMLEPRDLPGRYGRVVRAVERVLQATSIEAVLGGGWAVWRHGYAARITQDVDIALPADRIEEFRRTAAVSGFELLPTLPGRWPKMLHKETKIQVDILPEGAQPGRPGKLAPTTIPHPSSMGAEPGRLRYIKLASLIELKLAAARARDENDVVELLRANQNEVPQLRAHVGAVHPDYVVAFDRLAQQAAEPADNN
ncbi:MAG TPA: hypothetical protein VGZ47_24025 [Gemmataceae bacterium]|jgi:hypothetical protein|nr:hypothetical protein [Gemmataceae bacterium]